MPNNEHFIFLAKFYKFVCIIKEKLEIRSPQKKPLSIPVERGIFQARDNQVEIYLFQKNQEETKYGPTHLTDGPEHWSNFKGYSFVIWNWLNLTPRDIS